MKALVISLLVCLSVIASPTVLAQANDEAPSQVDGEIADIDKAESGENLPEPVKPVEEPESKGKPDERVFKPSEEISEDTSVAFPVDI